MKKFVSWMLSLIMIISIIPVTPASAADAVASGDCGENVTWALYDTDDDGTGDKLVISGSGEMADYEYVGGEQLTTSPWVEYREEITSVVIDEGVTHIGDEAFAFFYNLALIDIPLSVETIGRYSFYCCFQIQNVELPAGITSIGEGAFVSCRTLTNMVFPQRLTTIGDYSFSGCNLLETVYIPNTLESIGEVAFEATVLTDVYYDGTVAEWNNVVINSNNNELFSATIHCTDADYETIKSSGICGDDLTWTRYYNGKIVISGTGPMYDYEWDTSPFKSIGGNSIILEDGVTSIGNYALGYLNCTEVSIPNTVTSIGNEAFLCCTALKSITIPNSVTTIGDCAFSNTAIESITVPGSVTTIGLDIFHPCESLKNVVLSEGITYIAGAMFANCTALETVVIPSSVTTIDYLAFYNTSLSSITIPEGVKSIGADAFNSCTELSNVNYTGSKSQWTEITIESNNEALTNATIVYGKYDIVTADPENGTVSVDKATVARGETVTVTVTPAENYELEKILVNDVEITGNTFTPVEDSTVTAVFKPDAMASGDCGENVTWALYDTDDDGTGDKLVISGQGEMDSYENYTSVPWNSYRGNIKTVSVGNGVTTIGAYSFYGCTHLKEVTIPNSVNRIKSQAFEDCSYLEKITIPGSVKGIGDLAFYWCKSLKEVILEEGLLTIGESAFGECSALEKINIPNSVWYIDDYAFRQCRSLCEIKIPEDVTVINTGTFYNCTKLASITIPSKVTAIRSTAFWWCTSLKTMEFPESLTNIYYDAFNGCNAITDVYYDGTEAGWQKVSISKGNDYVKSAVVHIAKYVITVPQPENGTVSVDKATVARGETVTVTATAADGYELEKILVNDVEITGNTFTPVEDSTVTAVFKYVGGVKIGDTYYETLADAVAAAQSGETIKLLKDTATSGVLALTDSLTLDLNGYTLTSEYIVAFNGNNIIDSSESNSGLLVVAEDKFAIAKNNSQLPVKTESGYKFYEMVKINERLLSKEKYVFQPIIETAIHQELLKGMDATDIRIIVDVTYKTADAAGNEKTGKREFVYSDNFVETFVNSYNAETGKYGKMFSLTISDADKFESLTFTTRVVFADKVEFASPLA